MRDTISLLNRLNCAAFSQNPFAMKLLESPVTQHQFGDIGFFLKRDDQLHAHFSGNKARKFASLLELDQPDITTLISYGSAQANSLFSLAALACIKGWQLEYYVDRIPHWLKQQPIGNYRGALELGAQVIAVSECVDKPIHPRDYISDIRRPDGYCLVVPEGGRFKQAEHGVKQLARELLSWSRYYREHQFVVTLPSGTGATALYLHKHLAPHGIEVLTCPCVGGEAYLRSQFAELEPDGHPTILPLERKHHFGHLYREDYQIWQQLLESTGVEFDMLYDPLMWRCLSQWHQKNPDKTIIYVHQGGLLGNESMLPRYQRQYD